MASLLTLPLELLVGVSSYLTTPDLGALRLTCKQVEKSLYEWFSQEFFTKKQFMLTHKSLQAFIDISKHVSFSKKLTHVIIATNAYSDIPLRFRDSDAAARYIQGLDDQKVLLGTGFDCEMLTEAFRNLENLHTVGIRDFNNDKRHRDGVGASWSSWGATTVHQETGIELPFSGNAHIMQQNVGATFISRVFQSVIYALGKAKQSPQELEVLLRRGLLPDNAFSVPDFLQPTADPVLCNLKTLLLRVDLMVGSMHSHTNGTAIETKSGHHLRSFLGRTTKLTHLRLNLQKHQIGDNENFLEWMSLPAPAPGLQQATFFEPPPVELQSLTTLEFGQFISSANIILDVISKFAPTLRDISLWRMILSTDPGPALTPKPNVWATFFSKLTSVPQLNLSHLKAGMLSQDHFHVQFKDPDIKDAPALVSKEYTGNKMDAFLKELVDEAFVLWLPEVVQEDESDEDHEMIDEDDDIEDSEDEYEDEDEDEE